MMPLILVVTHFLFLTIQPTVSCQSRVFSCLPPVTASEDLNCICSRAPLPSSIQNLHEQIDQFSNSNISKISLSQCSAEHYTIKVELGKDDQDSVIKYSFADFVSGKLIFNGELRKSISIYVENVVGSLHLKGSLTCSDDVTEKPSLELNFHDVKSIQVSNFYVKRSKNMCNITFNVNNSQDFRVKSSRIRDIGNNVVSDSCQLNEDRVNCSEVFAEEKDFDDNTLEGMLVAIITLTFVAIAVICFRNRHV